MQRTTRPDLISDSIPRGLLYLAVPTWASHFLETSYNVVNGIWVGRVGTDSLAALNASAFFVWLVYSQLATVSTGASALVANAVGAGRRDQAERVAVQALSLALAMGTLLAFLGLALRHAVLELMGLEPGVVALGGAYLGIIFVIIPAMAIDECASAVLRGYGDTRTPTLVWSGVLLINIALAPLLVMGAGPVPAMGVRGAAMATAVGMSCGVLAYAALLGFGRLPFRIRLANFGAEHMRDVLRVGFPTSFSSVVFCLVYMGLTRVISEFGTEAVAAVGIGHRVESLSYMTCLALSIATITMVGQNKGAGRLDRAERSAWTAVGFGVAVTAVITLVMTVFSVPLARVFSDDPAVIPVAAGYIRIIGLCQIFMALDIVLEGAFSGAGDTVPPMLISIPLTLLRIPLAWYVAVHLKGGIMAVWWVISGLMVLRGVIMAWWFARGRWKSSRVMTLHEPLPFGDEEALLMEKS